MERGMFLVQISAPEQDEKGLTARMNTMREWLDHCRFEPSVFRYSSNPSGAVFDVEFKVEAEALAFAKEFGGRIVRSSAAKEAAD
jgi:hypothetical protein